MQRRREHLECESRPGLGCLVYGTRTCAHRRNLSTRWKRWMRRRLTVELWWVLLALVPLVCCWLWMSELVGLDVAGSVRQVSWSLLSRVPDFRVPNVRLGRDW